MSVIFDVSLNNYSDSRASTYPDRSALNRFTELEYNPVARAIGADDKQLPGFKAYNYFSFYKMKDEYITKNFDGTPDNSKEGEFGVLHSVSINCGEFSSANKNNITFVPMHEFIAHRWMYDYSGPPITPIDIPPLPAELSNMFFLKLADSVASLASSSLMVAPAGANGDLQKFTPVHRYAQPIMFKEENRAQVINALTSIIRSCDATGSPP